MSCIVSVTASELQKDHIMKEARLLGVENITVYAGNINTIELAHLDAFDRILMIEQVFLFHNSLT